MADGITFIGLDVHAATITAAAMRPGGELKRLGTFANTPAVIAERVARWGDPTQLSVAYEAGPCGYVLARQLAEGTAAATARAGLLTGYVSGKEGRVRCLPLGACPPRRGREGRTEACSLRRGGCSHNCCTGTVGCLLYTRSSTTTSLEQCSGTSRQLVGGWHLLSFVG